MSLTNNEVLEILKLIDESEYDEVRLEIGDVKIHVRKRGGEGDATAGQPIVAESPPPIAAPPAPSSASSTPAPMSSPPLEAGAVAVRAPMLGTFYRARAPGEKPFVEVGAAVSADDTVCLVEVMKLFNSVKAGVAGTVTGILVENGAMVEYDQVLITIKPTG